MTLGASTGRTETRPCSLCSTPVLHREVATLEDPSAALWLAEGHHAPCGLPCLIGARSPKRGYDYHGRNDHCPTCGWLRVVPEVIVEYRELVAEGQRLAAGARPPPWVAAPWDVLVPALEQRVCHVDAGAGLLEGEGDARFIGDVRTRGPAAYVALGRALDEIERLRREREDLQGALERARDEVMELRNAAFEDAEAHDEALGRERSE